VRGIRIYIRVMIHLWNRKPKTAWMKRKILVARELFWKELVSHESLSPLSPPLFEHTYNDHHPLRNIYTYAYEHIGLIKWVTSHVWMRQVTHMNRSWHTYEWIMPHIGIESCHAMNESYHTHQRVMPHALVSHWVMSNLWMSHVTLMNESCQTCEWVMSIYGWVMSSL